MSRVPIPDDWDEVADGWNLVMMCCPDSVTWRALVSGAIYNLTRGRKWDENTGIIKEAQATAWRIYDSMKTCDDLIIINRLLVGALTGQVVNLDDPLPTSGIVDFSAVGLASQLRTIDADKRIADVLEDQALSVTIEPTPVTIENNIDTQAIADNVEAFRTTYDTKMTAETVAANTRNADLITAIETLKLTCTTIVKASGCGSCGGSDPPSPPGIEGGDPPYGYSEPTYEGETVGPGSAPYNERKCKVANLLQDRIISAFEYINDMPYIGSGLDFLLDLFGAAWLFAISALINAYMATITILGISISVAGWVDELAQSLVEFGTDIDAIIANLQANRADYVCVLYNSPGTDVAISDYLGVAEDTGLNAVNIAVLSAFLLGDWISLLFFNRPDLDEQLEIALDGYVPPVDCTGCAAACVSYGFVEQNGFTLGTGDVDNGGVFSSVLDTVIGVHMIAVFFGANRDVTLSNLSGWTAQGGVDNDFRFGSWPCIDPAGGSGDEIYSSNSAPALPYNHPTIGGITIQSSSQFSVTVQFN